MQILMTYTYKSLLDVHVPIHVKNLHLPVISEFFVSYFDSLIDKEPSCGQNVSNHCRSKDEGWI